MSPLRKEWLTYARDGRMLLLLFTLGGMFFAAAALSGWQQEVHRRGTRAASAAEYTRWLEQPEKFAHAAAHYGMWAFKSPTALAALDPGVTPYLGSAVWMEAHQQNEVLHRPARDMGISERFGSLSPTVGIAVFAPLIILLAGFGTVAGERERGLWRMLLVQGASVRRVLWLKTLALAGWSVLAITPGVVLLAGLAVCASAADEGVWLRFACWVLAATVYVAVTAALIVGLSTMLRSQTRVLGAALGAWVVAAVLLPRFALGAAAAFAPLETQQTFAEDLKSALGAPDDLVERGLQQWRWRLLLEYGADNLAAVPVNPLGPRIQLAEERGNEIFDAQWGALFDGIERQSTIAEWLGVLSPPAIFSSVSQAITGNDFAHHRDFVVQAEAHRRLMQKTLNAEIERHPEVDGRRHLSGVALWKAIPPFHFELSPLSTVPGRWLPPLLMLCAWFAAAVLFVECAARREGVRTA